MGHHLVMSPNDGEVLSDSPPNEGGVLLPNDDGGVPSHTMCLTNGRLDFGFGLQ